MAEMPGAFRKAVVILGLALLLAGCGIGPQPNRPPTCLPTSDPLNCVPPEEDPAN